jgi:pimeloyl-ACP methyl ester carboxylesterase
MVWSPSESLEFESAGQTCRGVLARPADSDGPHPAIVLCTGFGGTQDTPAIQAAAAAFTRAGVASFTFDYRTFGVSDGHPRQVVDLAGQRADIEAAVTFVARQPGIDARRIALWGTSLGGGHVIVVAAGRPDIAAVIAQVPFNGFPRRVEGRSTTATLRLLGAMAVDKVRGLLGLSPSYIAAVGTPGTVAVMATDAAQQTIATLDSATWRNTVAPRVLFDMMRYRPGDSAGELTAPLLVCGARNDLESPPELVEQLVARSPNGRLIWYPVSHFQVYDPDVREGLIADQVAFLREVL